MRPVTLIFVLAVVSPALAQPPPPPAQSAPPKTQDQMPSANRENLAMPPPPRGRYSFAAVDEGFLRLDHKLGEVSLCRSQAGNWSCASVPDSAAASQKEIDELRAEVAALKREIAGQSESPRPRAEDDRGMKLELPSKEDLARARVFIEDTWRRLVEIIENLQKDMMHKKGENGVSRT